MLDLETMGTRPGSAIASIGAVVFDPLAGTLGEEFYKGVDLQSCARHGLSFDPDTIVWWLKQSEAARAALTTGRGLGLSDALGRFSGFYHSAGREATIWGHGGNFDEPLLSAAYHAVGQTTPWTFWRGRCTRTIYDLAGVAPDRAAGVHHNALDDAKAQALAVCAAYRKLGLAQ